MTDIATENFIKFRGMSELPRKPHSEIAPSPPAPGGDVQPHQNSPASGPQRHSLKKSRHADPRLPA
jgi:hypothetical protein